MCELICRKTVLKRANTEVESTLRNRCSIGWLKMKSSAKCPFSVTTTSCIFLCITVSLSMLCISLWLTSQGLTNYVQSMKIKLQEEGQIGKRLTGSSPILVETTHARPAERRIDKHFSDDDGFSDSWQEVRKHRTRLLTRTMCQQGFFLVIIVASFAEAYKNRMVIRHTWGTDNALHRKWKTVFLIGEGRNIAMSDQISREAQIFGDIIQGDYKETFDNKVFKIQSGFEWAAKYCNNFQYMLKTDDDVFVNTRGLIDFLSATGSSNTEFYFGHLMHGSPVLRSGYYAVSKEDHPEDFYKDYISGGGYVLSKDLVLRFTQMFDVVKPLKIDDAYIGMLAADIGVDPISSAAFIMYNDKLCNNNDHVLLTRPVSHECMVKLFDDVQKKILSPPKDDVNF